MRFVAAVGSDSFADEALAELREAGVELDLQRPDAPTGVAVILVDAAGENEIVVAPGANALSAVSSCRLPTRVLCQLEIPDEAVVAAWEQSPGSSASTPRPRGAIARRRAT